MDARISVQQPSIPTYRNPFFENLNLHYQITIFYGFDGVPSDLKLNVEKFFYPLITLKFRLFNLKWHTAQLKAVSKKFDAAILSWDVQYITLWLALLKGKILKVPIILWGHGYSKKEIKFKKFIRNLPTYFSAAIIFYDYHTAEEFKKKVKLNPKIFVAPNSLDQEKIQNAKLYWENNKVDLLNFQIKNSIDNTFNIIYIGRIYKENRLEILFKAIKHISNEIKTIKLIIIGEDKNDYASNLKELAIQLNIQKNIIWVGSVYDEFKIAPWMLSSKVFCYPSNIGLSLMHAFGYALPVIVSDDFSKHGPEIWALEKEFNGLTFHYDNYVHLSEQILTLYRNEKLRMKLAKNALKTVLNKFNIEEMTKGFIQAINFVVKK